MPDNLNIDDGSDLFLDSVPSGENEDAPEEETPEAEEAEPGEPQDTEEEPEADADPDAKPGDEKPGTLRVKHNHEEREITLEEAVPLIQKGLNYDAALQKTAADLQLLDKLAGQKGVTRAQFLEQLEQAERSAEIDREVEQLRTQHPEDSDAVLLELAKTRVTARAQEQLEQRRTAEEQERLKPWQEFGEKYPQYKDVKDIPPAVLDAIRAGESPVSAMLRHETTEKDRQIEDLKKKLEAKDKNTKNKAKAIGSAASDAGEAAQDAFLAGFGMS